MWKFFLKLFGKGEGAAKLGQNAVEVVEEISKDGTKIWQQITNKGGKDYEIVTKMTHPDKPNYLSESVERHIGDSFYRRTKVTQSPTDNDIYISAYNYKMPNGQIVNGEFHRKNYFSYIDDKMTSRNGYGRNHFLAFTKEADGAIHQTTMFHGPINNAMWHLRQSGGGSYDAVQQAVRRNNKCNYIMRFGEFL